jgi:TRAP-type C4-dicarboxylate transport system substrate-binding protein
MKNLGYQPIALETADILPSLQTGLINAVPSIPVYANAGQFYNHAPHMLELNWVPIVGGAVVTRKVWDKLAPATQEAMRKAALEAGQKIKDRSRKENDEAIQAMKKRGLQVHAVTPEIEAAWRKLAESAYPSIRGRIVPADIFDEVEQLLKTYRATTPRTAP